MNRILNRKISGFLKPENIQNQPQNNSQIQPQNNSQIQNTNMNNELKNPLITKACQIVASEHGSQLRKDNITPYFFHCYEVAKRALSYNDFSELTVDEIGASAVLHDVLEDTDLQEENIKTIFGEKVLCTVKELTMPKDFNSFEKKFEYLKTFSDKSKSSVLIKIADRTCNILDFYSCPSTAFYASDYALQAYPLLQAYIEIVEEDKEFNSNVFADIMKIEDIFRKRYKESLLSSNLTLIEKLIKETR